MQRLGLLSQHLHKQVERYLQPSTIPGQLANWLRKLTDEHFLHTLLEFTTVEQHQRLQNAGNKLNGNVNTEPAEQVKPLNSLMTLFKEVVVSDWLYVVSML